MRATIITLSITVALVIGLRNATAQSSDPYPGEVGRLGASARPLALGEAFSAVAGDATASLWNPAAMTAVRRGSLHMSHRQVESGLAIDTANLAVRPPQSPRLTLGASATVLTRGAIRAGELGTGSAAVPGEAEFLGNLGAAVELTPELSLGLELGRLESTFRDPDVARGWNSSAGMLWQRGPTSVGVALRGLSFGMKSETAEFPYRYRMSAGAAHRFDRQMMLAAQIDRDRAADPVLGMGVEWTPEARLAIRGGVRQAVGEVEATPQYSGGVGVQNNGFSLDYAARFGTEQQPEHVVSIGYQFGTAPPLTERVVMNRSRHEAVPDRSEFHDAPVVTQATPPSAPPVRPEASAPPVPPEAPVTPPPSLAADSRSAPPPVRPQTNARRESARATAELQPDATVHTPAPRNVAQRFVVRGGVYLDIESATNEVARFYRAKLRPTIERRGSMNVVVLLRCESLAEAEAWVEHAGKQGLRCTVDEE